ncbi:MAG: trimeric intracellular cation channel family protein [Ruminococcus sp.]|nr:trimeric intracellular cation channel family protein [Ruminococcus sp.]
MDTLLMVFDILGTLAFAVSGAIVGVRRRMDIFGVTVLAIVTATGGGILRDLMIGSLPPQALLHPRYVAIAAGAGLICFLVMCFHPHPAQKAAAAYDMVMFCFDTLGVAAFTADGVAVAIDAGFGNNVFLMVLLGVITGVGGGVIRDVLSSRVPQVFQKHVYALASIIGAVIMGVMVSCGIKEQIGIICGFAVIVLLRVLAARFRWNLPRVGKAKLPEKAAEQETDREDSDHSEN